MIIIIIIINENCLWWFTWREWRRTGCQKRSSLKNWKGRDEEEDPGKDGQKKWNKIFKCWE
jgi:hypothetical protein